jgi:hypothetical protein
MKKLFAICLLFTAATSWAQTTYWQQKADFTIDVTLNVQDHSLEAFEKISYTNNSPDTLHFILRTKKTVVI